MWNLCYDSLKIKYAKLQAELSFACAQRPFYSHSSKTSLWILLPTPEWGKPANNSKYNMRRQMLQKSVWRGGTMLRSAEVDALLNQIVLVLVCLEQNAMRKQGEDSRQYPVSLITDATILPISNKRTGQWQLKFHQLFYFLTDFFLLLLFVWDRVLLCPRLAS